MFCHSSYDKNSEAWLLKASLIVSTDNSDFFKSRSPCRVSRKFYKIYGAYPFYLYPTMCDLSWARAPLFSLQTIYIITVMWRKLWTLKWMHNKVNLNLLYEIFKHLGILICWKSGFIIVGTQRELVLRTYFILETWEMIGTFYLSSCHQDYWLYTFHLVVDLVVGWAVYTLITTFAGFLSTIY